MEQPVVKVLVAEIVVVVAVPYKFPHERHEAATRTRYAHIWSVCMQWYGIKPRCKGLDSRLLVFFETTVESTLQRQKEVLSFVQAGFLPAHKTWVVETQARPAEDRSLVCLGGRGAARLASASGFMVRRHELHPIHTNIK